jgi:hypothetical protein
MANRKTPTDKQPVKSPTKYLYGKTVNGLAYTHDFGFCPVCDGALAGRGRLVHLETGSFNPMTYEPFYAPATLVCERCESDIRVMGRVRAA